MTTLYVWQFGCPNQTGGLGRNCEANIRELLDNFDRPVNLGFVQVDAVALLDGNAVVSPGDIILVNGHGAPDSTRLYYDGCPSVPADTAVTYVRNRLQNQAGDGVTIYWVVCYSARQGHVADVCKQRIPNATVYGTSGAHGGGLCRLSRRGVNGMSFDGQMEEMT
jgi:hypothetical protein